MVLEEIKKTNKIPLQSGISKKSMIVVKKPKDVSGVVCDCDKEEICRSNCAAVLIVYLKRSRLSLEASLIRVIMANGLLPFPYNRNIHNIMECCRMTAPMEMER